MIHDGQWPWAAVNHSIASPGEHSDIKAAFLACLLRHTWNLGRHSRWYVIPGLSEGNRSQLQTLAKEFRLCNSGNFHIEMCKCQLPSFTNISYSIYFAKCVRMCDDWDLSLSRATKIHSVHHNYLLNTFFVYSCVHYSGQCRNK